jgi:hypothetical protein
MRRVALLLNQLVEAGVILDYAMFGAVAQMRYTEAVVTMDADILVGIENETAIDALRPIYVYCRDRGFLAEGEAIRVGDWPVQFIPVFSPVTRSAMVAADTHDLDGVPIRVVTSDYLAAIALEAGRGKDHARILALLEVGATSVERVGALASQHGLVPQWRSFRQKYLGRS